MDFNRIKVALVENKVKSKDLADALDVTRNTVSLWCNNKNQPTVENLFRIANHLGVRAGDLLVDNLKQR